ncbi:MAG: ribose-phosphate pyrophosphokinase [Candidatus Diapherotrites archaeon]|nr:ribose-phosphate pyrophosphokinase [Candidatus Diapherotrites archaeon]
MNSFPRIFSGTANPELAAEIASKLNVTLGKIELKKFADGELYANFLEKVRGEDLFLIQPTCFPQNDNLMELLIMIDAAQRASAGKITAVLPYFGYAKQDRKVGDREPITAKLVANLLKAAGASRVLLVDLHSDQIQAFFEIQADFLYAAPVLVEYFRKKNIPNLVVVTPDVGGLRRARAYAERLGAELAVVDKRRPRQNEAEVMNVIGDVEGKNCLILDDEINTGGTIVNAANALKARGAHDIYLCCIHPVFAGDCVRKLQDSPAKEVVVTNTIPVPSAKRFPKLKILSVAGILAEAITSLHTNSSLSELLKKQLNKP